MKKNLPKISIITPSYNQAPFIERTISSVLSQNYPNLEYIVMDGGSNDGTLDILKKNKKKIIWESHKDNGQTDAINQGIRKSTGEIIGYLNSDDILLPKALEEVVNFFKCFPDYLWATGNCHLIDVNGNIIHSFISAYKNFWLRYFRNYSTLSVINFISQPATFWKRELVEKIGLFDQSLYYAMDYDYWLRICKIYKLGFIQNYLAAFRVQRDSKSGRSFRKLLAEGYKVTKKYNGLVLTTMHKIHDLMTICIYSPSPESPESDSGMNGARESYPP